MFSVIKNKGKVVNAYQLGDKNPVIDQLVAEGKIKVLDDHKYEVFSQEVIKAESGHGEIASVGDYVKIDGSGSPYPNSRKYFGEHHKHIAGNQYEQIPTVLCAWDVNEPMCKEIQFLMEQKGLVLSEEHPERFYTVPLWGTVEAADINAVLIFYSITYENDGTVKDASFNLIEKSEFEKTYNRC